LFFLVSKLSVNLIKTRRTEIDMENSREPPLAEAAGLAVFVGNVESTDPADVSG
jgi:hypothetical protein